MTKIGSYEVLEHSETVKPERFVVFVNRNGRLERATNLGKRGGFLTWAAAIEAATNQAKYGTQNV